MTENELHKLLRVLDFALIEIRSLPEESLTDARIIANAMHKLPNVIENWESVEFSKAVDDLRGRFMHHKESQHLANYLPKVDQRDHT